MAIPGQFILTAIEAGGIIALQQSLNGSPMRSIAGTPPAGAFVTLTPFVTIEERHSDELAITQHPVESGAAITDHAYKIPPSVMIEAGWSNSPVPMGSNLLDIPGLLGLPGQIAQGLIDTLNIFSTAPNFVKGIYDQLLALQDTATLLTVMTGKRSYDNMLITRLETVTNSETENALIIRITCQQIIIVQTQVVTVAPQAQQLLPEKTASIISTGAKQVNSVGNAILGFNPSSFLP